MKLTVKSGLQKPYLYKSKSIQTKWYSNDRSRYTRIFKDLFLEGQNIRFEELPCKDQELSFEVLHRKLSECIQIENFSKDTLKTLNLYDNDNGYNNAAGLLADKNHFPRIDMGEIRWKYQSIIQRSTFENRSVLEEYDKSVDVFRDYYQYMK